MSTESHTNLFMPSMTIIGGAKPFQRFIGPDRAAERVTYTRHMRMPYLELTETYFVLTDDNRLHLCYFDEWRLTFMLFEYPYYKRYWHSTRETRVVEYQDEFELTGLLYHQERLPKERITLIERPRPPISQERTKAHVRYVETTYIIVIGKYRYISNTDERTYIFPCVYLGENRWHNNSLVDDLAHVAPESWCYLEDLLVPVHPQENECIN